MLFGFAVTMCLSVGCSKSQTSGNQTTDKAKEGEINSAVDDNATDADKNQAVANGELIEEILAYNIPKVSTTDKKYDTSTDEIKFSSLGGLYYDDLEISISTVKAGDIYLTTDGSIPTKDDIKYTKPVEIKKQSTDFPRAVLLRAKVFYSDGTTSKVYSNSYIVSDKNRFSTMVVSIMGDPKDLTESPFGIFYGNNYEKRGRESEEPVFVEAWESDGTLMFRQDCGVRIYGAYSRMNTIKSMKLYARADYDEIKKNFYCNLFNTETLGDTKDKYVDKYKRLVLRSAANDYQFAYIRDELNQTLAKKAGFDDYEAVRPALVFLNGDYYGLLWLHESYCDNYFRNKYGDKGKTGEFVVLEGGERYKKNDDEDEVKQEIIDEYNALYEEFAYDNLTDDDTYSKLQEWMDVESYLRYYAYNIYLSNKDWPHNNYKLYRYIAGEGENYENGTVYDGRYRWLLHDIDYTLGLYNQEEVKASYDTLKIILRQSDDRYAPLLDHLLARDDCKEHFIEYLLEFAYGALSKDSIEETLNQMNTSRMEEQSYYYQYLASLRAAGDYSIWSEEGHLQGYLDEIVNFASQRAFFMKYQIETNLKISDKRTYTIEVKSNSKVKINELTVGDGFSNVYYNELTTTFCPLLAKGEKFSHWEVNGEKVTDQILNLTNMTDNEITIKLVCK